MTIREYFSFIVDEIHSTVIATVDDNGLPVTCTIDIMDFDENGLYFLTAKGKGFYDRLKKQGFIALTGMRGKDTLSCVAVSVRGLIYPKNRLNGLVLHLGAEKLIKNVILLRINASGANYVIPVVLKNVST